MKVFEVTGKTVREAIQEVLYEYDLQEDEIEVQVIEKGKKGLLGLVKARAAKIKVKLREKALERKLKTLINTLLMYFHVDADISIKKREHKLHVELSGKNLGTLIGRHGQILASIQHILNMQVNNLTSTRMNVYVDVDHYNEYREDKLEKIAFYALEKVRKTRKKVELDPMQSRERKEIHRLLSAYPYIHTYSEGVEPYRYVVVEYVGKG